MAFEKLSKMQQDEVCRISQQGMIQAAEMLSRLLRQTVEVEVADAWMSDSGLSAEQASAPNLGVYMRVSGDIAGGLLLALSVDCAEWLSGQLLGGTAGNGLLLEPASSTLKEVGNIIASSFLASVDDQLGLRAMPSPPTLSSLPLGELLQSCQSNRDETCLIVRTRLLGVGSVGDNLQAAIYLFPEPAALEKLLLLL